MATIKDVAETAGVSTATVSHVLNGTRYVSEKLRLKVQQAMEELDYLPNQMARSLRGRGTRTLGLIAPDYADLYFAEVGSAFEEAAASNGYSVIYCNSRRDFEKEKHYIDDLISKNVDGIIFVNTGRSDRELVRLLRQNIPVLFFDWKICGIETDCVLLDNELGGSLATEYLLDLGHRRIACISNSSENDPILDRVNAYKKALQRRGIQPLPEYLIFAGYSVTAGKRAMKALMTLPDPPTAVFATTDQIAIGAMFGAQELELAIPERMSIVGFDDLEVTKDLHPPLTTIDKKIAEMCDKAIELLLHRIDAVTSHAEPRDGVEILITPELVVRQSCARFV